MKQDKLIVYPKKAKGEDGYKTFSGTNKRGNGKEIGETSFRDRI